MKKIIFAVLILFVFPSSLLAGALYSCIDRDGNVVLTDSPQDGMKKCVLGESFVDKTPAELAKEQREDSAYRQRMNAETERKQSARDAVYRVQESRDRRASRTKAAADARLQAVEAAGIRLPREYKDLLEKAAEVKAEQIRQGTDTPMTAQEDANFHREQEMRTLEWKQQEIESKQREIESKQRQLEWKQLFR